MTHIEPSSVARFWAGVIAVAIMVYVILDGFDLGVGILFGATRQAQLYAIDNRRNDTGPQEGGERTRPGHE